LKKISSPKGTWSQLHSRTSDNPLRLLKKFWNPNCLDGIARYLISHIKLEILFNVYRNGFQLQYYYYNKSKQVVYNY
jgi:hypothetical protein